MVAARLPITNKRLWCSVIVAASLCLVFLGMKIPDISRLHSPKPRPRAVVTTAVKACPQAGIRVQADVETCQPSLLLNFPEPFRSSSQQEIHKFCFIPIKQHSARAPPVIAA